MQTIKLTDEQVQVLQSILEDHMLRAEKCQDDGTKHNMEYLERLFKALDGE